MDVEHFATLKFREGKYFSDKRETKTHAILNSDVPTNKLSFSTISIVRSAHRPIAWYYLYLPRKNRDGQDIA